MLYMIIEKFRNGDPRPVYTRFREEGRLIPEGLDYVASWITEDLRKCFQVMRCDDPALLDVWMSRWKDVMDFEVIPVVTSETASAATA